MLNTIAILGTVLMAVDKESIGVSRVHIHVYTVICPHKIFVYSVLEHR